MAKEWLINNNNVELKLLGNRHVKLIFIRQPSAERTVLFSE